MFKKPTKKQLLIRRIALSVVATLAVIIIATVTIFFMLGYRLDSVNGRLQQGALLQFDSNPNGADVYIDDRAIGSRTATKQTVMAGTHSIKIARQGYQDWNRTVDLAAGTLTWLDYIRLVPNDRPVQTVTTYETLVNATISPDSKWALTQEKADVPSFHLVDLRSEDVKSSVIALPQDLYTDATTEGVTHAFSLLTWDNSGRYTLVKHMFKDQTEWLVMDTQNLAQSVNITRLLSVGFKDLQFSGTSGKIFYGLTDDGTIRKVDLSAGTISRSFVTHVDSFTLFDNKIVSFVALDPADATKRIAGVYRDGDEVSHTLRTANSLDSPLKIATGQYFNDYYFAIAENNSVEVLRGSYPTADSQGDHNLKQFTKFDLAGAVSRLTFSPGSDYVLAQSGESFKSYEIEHRRTDVGALTIINGATATPLKWLDGAHLWNDDGGVLTLRDFNGINTYEIMKVEPGFDARFSQNGRFFYAIGKDDKGYHIQRVKMILE